MAAPKSNTNALKHGLYAKQFNQEQVAGLKKMAWDDFRHEEFAHRAIGQSIFKLLNALLSGQTIDIDQVVKLVNSLCNNTIATATCARTYALLNREDESDEDPLSQALDDVPFDIIDVSPKLDAPKTR